MPFGRKKSNKDGDLDTQKASLFGKSAKASKSPSPSAANPYAVPPPSSDPYAQRSTNPYAAQGGASASHAPRSQSSLSQPPTSSLSSLTLSSEQGGPPDYNSASGRPNRYEKSPVPAGGYGGSTPRYQNNGSYGQTGGYGSDPYGSNPYGGGQPRYGPSGYGGLGRSNSRDTMTTDAGRDALFGDAAKRVQEQRAATTEQQNGDSSYSNTDNQASAGAPGSYGYGADHELTAEEQEEQEVDATKQEIRYVKKQTKQSLKNSESIVDQIVQTGSDTLNRLGQQGDRIHNTERNLDRSQFHAADGKDKADYLRRLNDRPFFVPATSVNPFNGRARRERQEEESLRTHQQRKRQTEETQKYAYETAARQQGQQRDIHGNVIQPTNQRSLAERAKYQFEADSEDDEDENDIDASM